MNKPDTKELRRIAREITPIWANSTTRLMLEAADFIDSLEGKHVCEWPKELTRERLQQVANGFSERATIHGMLHTIAAIAPDAPKKRRAYIYERELPHGMIERAWHDSEWTCHAADGGWRKVGECEIDA